MILGMVPPSAGTIRFQGKDLTTIRGTGERLGFMKRVQPIFQNPFEAFNPMKRVDRYLFATGASHGQPVRRSGNHGCRGRAR